MSTATDEQILLKNAGEVARRFREYRSYGSLSRARSALKGRSPGWSKQDYIDALADGFAFYDTTLAAVKGRSADVWETLRVKSDVERRQRLNSVAALVASEVAPQLVRYSTPEVEQMILWVIYWHYMR